MMTFDYFQYFTPNIIKEKCMRMQFTLSLSLSHIRIATSTSVRFFFSFFAVFYSNLFFLEKFICALVKNIIVPIKSEGDYKNKKVER